MNPRENRFEAPAVSMEEARLSPASAPKDVAAILRQRRWLGAAEKEAHPEWTTWRDRAAQLLCPHAETRAELESLLTLVFEYDVAKILGAPENHAVLARAGAREVIRELGREVLGGPEIDSDRLKEIVNRVMERSGYRGRELFHPLRLALAGRAGDGELDRVVLLLDAAAGLPFAVRVKGARQRMLEFCTALD